MLRFRTRRSSHRLQSSDESTVAGAELLPPPRRKAGPRGTTIVENAARVLEQAGLVTTEKVGRVRTCKLGPRRLKEETAWLETYLQLWDSRFEELDKVVDELKRKEKVDGRKKRE